MARPSEPEKRQELALRAVEILQREGFDCSMTRLAEALEVKRPTLLYHFPTRADVVVAALESILMEQARFVLGRLAAVTHPIDRLFAQVQAIHAFHEGREDRIVFLTQALATSGDERLAASIAVGNKVFEAHRKAQADAVRRGIDAGIVEPCDVDGLMALIRSVSDGLVVQRVMIGAPYGPAHDFLWEHVLAPLKRDPRHSTTSTTPDTHTGHSENPSERAHTLPSQPVPGVGPMTRGTH